MAMATEMRTYGLSMRRFMGKDVMGPSADKIGEVDDVILNSMNGCAMFAVVDEGGFLGMGERHHVVPWKALSWTADTNQLTANFNREKLTNAPVFDRGNPPEWGNETWQRSIYDYFGVPYEGTMGGSMSGTGMGGQGGMGGGSMGGGSMGGQGGGSMGYPTGMGR